jgi:polysaccharide pyruvyl transferase WcaK-like protein
MPVRRSFFQNSMPKKSERQFKKMSSNKTLRIYIDHWEDYESVGDQAMLLNAMRRLELHLGACQFVFPISPRKKDRFQYPNLISVTPPYQEVTNLTSWLKYPYRKLSDLILENWSPKVEPSIFLELAIFLTNVKFQLYLHGLHFVFNKPFRSFLEELSKCDVFFTVGDCSLNDHWLDGVRLKSWLITLASQIVPVSVLSSQGIGPLTLPWARKRLVVALNHLDILSLRDFSYSNVLVESEGLRNVPHRIVADEAFSYPVSSQSEVWEMLHSTGISESEPYIAVNFRHTDFTQNTTYLLDKISDFLDRVTTTTNKKIVFVPMSSGNDYGRDYEAGLSLKSKMVNNDRFILLEPIKSIELVKGIIGTAAYSIGISYHLHVFSLSQGHPTLIIYTGSYYKTKSDGLISFYGQPYRAIDFSEVSTELTMEQVLDIENNYVDECENVRKVNADIIKSNDWTILMLKSILEKKGIL